MLDGALQVILHDIRQQQQQEDSLQRVDSRRMGSELSENEVIVGGIDGLVRLLDLSVRPARVMDVFKEGQKPTIAVYSTCRMTRNQNVVSDYDGHLHILTKS